MKQTKWSCPKCGHGDFDIDEFRATGGILSSLFNIHNKRFSAITCRQCSYTEIYRIESSKLDDMFDVFAN
ncbi:MAG: zinc ribbon domain-containing protein [Pirellulaceae bacterium]